MHEGLAGGSRQKIRKIIRAVAESVRRGLGHSASTGERKTATVLFSGAVSFGTADYIRGGVTTIRVMATAFLDRGRAQWTVPAELKDVCCTQCSVRKISVLVSDVE